MSRSKKSPDYDVVILPESNIKKLIVAADKMHSVLLGRVTFLIGQDPQKGSRWGKELIKLAKIVESYEIPRYPMLSSRSASRKKKGSKILAYYRS